MVAPVPVVLLSGGIDSAVVAALYAQRHGACRAVFFDYGQPPATPELAAARGVAAHVGANLERIALPGLPARRDGEVWGRNALFVLHAAARVAPGACVVAVGIHAGSPYYDTSPRFVRDLQAVLDGYSNGTVALDAPLIDLSKREVAALAQRLGVPLGLTYSCQASAGCPCGACPSCLDRRALGVD